MRDWVLGTNGKWTSMGIKSSGQYGIAKGLFYSYPLVVENGNYTIVDGL